MYGHEFGQIFSSILPRGITFGGVISIDQVQFLFSLKLFSIPFIRFQIKSKFTGFTSLILAKVLKKGRTG